MLFNFALFPLGETIIDELDLDGKHASLCWYNLTDGWYWIDVGTEHLFRYTPECLRRWSANDPRPMHWPYVDYQVARLWEDLLDILPAVLEPLPPALAQRLVAPLVWNEWLVAFQDWTQSREEEDEEEDFDILTRWWFERKLDTGYLVEGPQVWLWNDGTHIHLVWDNCERLLEGVAVWTATTGEVLVPVAEFLEEVSAFDHHLMNAMTNRVKAARQHWAQPGYQEELAWLEKEQVQRAGMLAHTLEAMTTRKPTDWEQIMTLLTQAEHDLTLVIWQTQHGR